MAVNCNHQFKAQKRGRLKQNNGLDARK